MEGSRRCHEEGGGGIYRENSSSTRPRKMTENGEEEGERWRQSITTATIATSAITITITPPTINGPRTARAGSISVSACNLPRRMLMDRTPSLSPSPPLHLENSSTCHLDLVIDRGTVKPRRPARKVSLVGKKSRKEKGWKGRGGGHPISSRDRKSGSV